MVFNFKFISSEKLKEKPDESNLGFGKYFTDYMFEADYTEELGWHDNRIVPFAPMKFDPFSLVLHNG